MDERIKSEFYGTDLVDMFYVPFKLDDMVAKPIRVGNSADLEIGKVTKIDLEKKKVYLDNSKVALWYPGRCLIVTGLFIENPNDDGRID